MNTDPIVTEWARALRDARWPLSTRCSGIDSARQEYGLYGVLAKVVGQEPTDGGSSTARCAEPVRKLVTDRDIMHFDATGVRMKNYCAGTAELSQCPMSCFVGHGYDHPLTFAQLADLIDYFGVRRNTRPVLRSHLAA